MRAAEVPESILEFLMGNDLVYVGLSDELCIKSAVKLALELLKLGSDAETVSKPLNWKDFEELINEYLGLRGYYVIRGLRFGRRRYEVDVIGIDEVSKVAFIIDCKHWSPGYSKRGRLAHIAKEHRSKVEVLSTECDSVIGKCWALSRAKVLIPVIVTLTDVVRGYVGGSFIVPVLRFNDFICNAQFYVDSMVSRSDVIINKCYREA